MIHPSSSSLDVAVGPGALLAEGPRWDDSGWLWWVDVAGREIHRFDPVSGDDEAQALTQSPSVVLPRSGGGHVLVADQALWTYSWGEIPVPLLEVCPGVPEIRLNDAACDSFGRLWAGSYHVDRVEGVGAWYLVDPVDLEGPTPLFAGATLPNGVAVTPAGDAMFLVDSRRRRVDRVAIDPVSGAIGESQQWLSLADVDGVPDGLTVDAEGGIWIAFYFGRAVRHYSPEGALIQSVELPVGRVTSVAFGGRDLQDLYVTTARGESEQELAADPLGGALFVLPSAGQGTRHHGLGPRFG